MFVLLVVFSFFFFFSSRRRHTRYWRDWSSDVCSSDLGLERVGIDDSFFELGGDSISAMRVIAAINSGLDVELAVRTIFAAPTVSGPGFASVHGRDVAEVHARDLTLDKFIDETILADAPTLPRPSAEVRTV